MEKIVINTHKKVVLVDVNEINYLEALGAYTIVSLTKARKIKVSKNITTLSKYLTGENFIRTSRHNAINLNNITEITKEKDKAIVHFDNKSKLEISKRLFSKLLGLIEDFYKTK